MKGKRLPPGQEPLRRPGWCPPPPSPGAGSAFAGHSASFQLNDRLEALIDSFVPAWRVAEGFQVGSKAQTREGLGGQARSRAQQAGRQLGGEEERLWAARALATVSNNGPFPGGRQVFGTLSNGFFAAGRSFG